MSKAREQVLDYIGAQRVVTASEVARALHMTAANARHHLSILEKRGLVELVGVRPTEGRGRPIKLYGLSDHQMGNNLGRLASAFLEEYVADSIASHDVRIRVFGNLARRMVADVSINDGDFQGGQRASLTERLYRAVYLLNEMHYQARWEAHADAPQVILEHCPYAAILPEHLELCQLDNVLLGMLLHVPVKQLARRERDSRGIRYCVFALR